MIETNGGATRFCVCVIVVWCFDVASTFTWFSIW